jgi:hypothetical protein
MLLNVWDSWWTSMVRLRAEEERTTFVIMQAADSGWRMDREALWRGWERLTAPKPTGPTKDVRGQMHRFADFMVAGFGAFGSLIRRHVKGQDG